MIRIIIYGCGMFLFEFYWGKMGWGLFYFRLGLFLDFRHKLMVDHMNLKEFDWFLVLGNGLKVFIITVNHPKTCIRVQKYVLGFVSMWLYDLVRNLFEKLILSESSTESIDRDRSIESSRDCVIYFKEVFDCIIE